MTEQEVDEFLRGRHTMSLATINHDATVHLVAMWYGFLEGCVAIETKTKSQKVRNLRRNPRMTCMVEDGDRYEDLRGVELVGTAEIVEEPERMWEMGVNLFERYQGTYTEEMRPFVEAMLHKGVVGAELPDQGRVRPPDRGGLHRPGTRPLPRRAGRARRDGPGRGAPEHDADRPRRTRHVGRGGLPGGPRRRPRRHRRRVGVLH